jgi:hypothetical protein
MSLYTLEVSAYVIWPRTDTSEHDNKLAGSTKCEKFLDQLFLKKTCSVEVVGNAYCATALLVRLSVCTIRKQKNVQS